MCVFALDQKLEFVSELVYYIHVTLCMISVALCVFPLNTKCFEGILAGARSQSRYIPTIHCQKMFNFYFQLNRIRQCMM